MKDKWDSAEHYESYIGRWSRGVAAVFLSWLKMDRGLEWIDVGSGTGALTSAILNTQDPKRVMGVDPSEEHVNFLRKAINDPRTVFETGSAADLPAEDDSADAIVSGLVLNFVPDHEAVMKEFNRAAKGGATVAAYVWDYAGRMEMLRYFWDAAAGLFDDAREKDEGMRFPICRPDALRQVFLNAGFRNIEVSIIDIPTKFEDFEDYWTPFLSGIGPAPGYCMSLTEENRMTLMEKVYSSLPVNNDGTIDMIARAIAVKAVKP